jgi:hypothetical protein
MTDDTGPRWAPHGPMYEFVCRVGRYDVIMLTHNNKLRLVDKDGWQFTPLSALVNSHLYKLTDDETHLLQAVMALRGDGI